jgi:septal ring factor EnvC (AmiA/AmiB activator)
MRRGPPGVITQVMLSAATRRPGTPTRNGDADMRSLKMILPLALMSLIPLALGACGGGDDEATTGDQQTDRQEIMAELEGELEQIDRKLQLVGDRIDNATDEADAELKKTYADLKVKREDIADSMDDLRNASEDRWDTVHRELEDSLEEFAGNVEQAWKDLGL